jgi:hypothetical protein
VVARHRRGDGEVLLTLKEAVSELYPPITEEQLAGMVHVTRLQPRGFRRTGTAGRPARTYPMGRLYELHRVLVPLLTEFAREGA